MLTTIVTLGLGIGKWVISCRFPRSGRSSPIPLLEVFPGISRSRSGESVWRRDWVRTTCPTRLNATGLGSSISEMQQNIFDRRQPLFLSGCSPLPSGPKQHPLYYLSSLRSAYLKHFPTLTSVVDHTSSGSVAVWMRRTMMTWKNAFLAVVWMPKYM